ncbi:MAG: 16S rRNA (guanine(966)-N(2))-methyltransferase RsmD [Blastocatellia bacterium]|nr:16S rRNA (guanine(966)-N(2))-methyltransferase RsmD [Blastocatellia bacterium]
MRIISGKFKGRRIQTVDGLEVRPTSDRLRETLFNILSPDIDGATFLDLCAGSGAVGIEALSRGAEHVTFVEHARRAITMLVENLRVCHIEEGVDVVQRDVVRALKQLVFEERHYDLIFFDPPYASHVYGPVMSLLSETELLDTEGRLIAEHHSKHEMPETIGHLRRYREVRQGESCLSFYARI